MVAFAINYFQQGCKSSMVSHWAGRSGGRAHSWFQALSSPLPASRLSSATHSSFHRNSPTWSSPRKNSPTQFSPEKNSSSSTLLVCYTRSTLALPLQTSLKKRKTRDKRLQKKCQLPPHRFMPLRLMLVCLVKVPGERGEAKALFHRRGTSVIVGRENNRRHFCEGSC